MDLSEAETLTLEYLQASGKEISEMEMHVDGLSEREIASAVSWLQVKGFVVIKTMSNITWTIGPEGKEYQTRKLPELRAAELIASKSESEIQELSTVLDGNEIKIALAQLAKLGVRPDNRRLTLGKDAGSILNTLKERQSLLERIKENTSDKDAIRAFSNRDAVLKEVKTYSRIVSLTKLGVEYHPSSGTGKIQDLTQELLVTGRWKGKEFMRYDLNAPTERINTAYLHPLSALIDKIRSIFLRLGFTEMPGHFVEFAGWNMDSLFIPQYHPAREMQDTFYLETMKKPEFEHPEVLEIFRKVHGRGIPGYTGWEYNFDLEEARRLVLRTHTTVSTIRNLYKNNEAPRAIFSVEKVFRHESVDWKHLAELHQVEGAVYSPYASMSTLKGLMRQFYSALGFEDLTFIPSYYPYTEPSMDVVARLDGREVELGGSGVFRPEVTRPLGLKYPVIAWGLGLERLAMLLFGLKDIRDLYNSDLDWLRSSRALL